MSKITLTLDRLEKFVQCCCQVFATKKEVKQNDDNLKNLQKHVFEITEEWYQTYLSFPPIENESTSNEPEPPNYEME